MGIHVLQLGPYPPPEGGITRNMLAIRDRLQERSDRCSIIATSRSTSIRGEIDVFHPRSAAELISLVRTIDHDVLHLHVGGEINKRVLSLCIAAATFGKRAVLSVHSGGFAKTHEASKAKPGSARALIFRRFAKIIAVNAELRDVFIRYGVSPGDVQVIAPFSLAPPEPEAHSSPRLAGFARAHTPFLLSVGGL